MKYIVHISPEAESELDKATAWYRRQDKHVAEVWYRGFRKVIAGLGNNPEQHGLCEDNDRFTGELRQLLYGSGRRKTHRAIFRIVGNRVEVLTIRHLAQRDLEPEDIQ